METGRPREGRPVKVSHQAVPEAPYRNKLQGVKLPEISCRQELRFKTIAMRSLPLPRYITLRHREMSNPGFNKVISEFGEAHSRLDQTAEICMAWISENTKTRARATAIRAIFSLIFREALGMERSLPIRRGLVRAAA